MPRFYRSARGTIARAPRHALAQTVAPCAQPIVVTIESLDHEGRGIARVEGKAVFVEGALPGERVAIDDAQAQADATRSRAPSRSRKSSASRVDAALPAFRRLRRLLAAACDAVAAGRREAARARGRAGADRARAARSACCRRSHGPAWELPASRAAVGAPRARRRAACWSASTSASRASSPTCASATCCRARSPTCCPRCARWSAALSIRDRVPQIELAVGERRRDGRGARARVPDPRAAHGRRRSGAASRSRTSTASTFWLQTGRARRPPRRFIPADSALAYALPEFDVVVPFGPTEFTQVNPQINRVLVRRAIALLDPQPGERIADFFCGLGQLHAADRAPRRRRAVGIEGSAALVRPRRGKRRAQRTGRHGTRFVVANLFAATPESVDALRPLDKVADRPAARRRDRARQGAARGDASARCSGSCTSRAIRPRSRATRRCSCTIAATRWRPRAWSTCSRTPRTSSRSRCSRADAKTSWPKKRGDLASPRCPLCGSRVSRHSRCPVNASSRLSRLMKML